MEGVGARLGRSSTRYGPATVFTGPVRKWKKKWVHVSPNHHHHPHHNHHHHHSRHHAAADAHATNGSAVDAANDSNVSHLLLYKWTPISQSGTLNGNSDGEGLEKGSRKEDEEPPRRKFKYIPIAILEEPKNEEESVGNVDEEAKPNPKNEVSDEKPDINDVPMEENEDGNQGMRQDLNETLDLTL